MSDTDRLNWLVKNRALVSTGGSASPDPFFFVVYKDGTTADWSSDFRKAIDMAIAENP